MSNETMPDEIMEPVEKAKAKGTFNIVNVLRDRGYPEVSVVVYIDEASAYDASVLKEKINAAKDGEDVSAIQGEHDALLEKLMESSVTFYLKGISESARDAMLKQAKKKYPVEVTKDVNPMTGEWVRDEKESQDRDELFTDLLWHGSIVKIEDAGVQNVYSVKVDSDCHSFVANGIINHNTEAKFSAFGDQMVAELSNQVVDYVSNYNDELMEPTVLPSLFPNLIVNGCSGIAVGWATNMAPHNLREVANLIDAYIKNPDITVEEIMEIVPGPDFPLPCKILGTTGIKNYFTTGRGSVQLEGYHTIESERNGQQYIKITALPYGGSADGICKEIKEICKKIKKSYIRYKKSII